MMGKISLIGLFFLVGSPGEDQLKQEHIKPVHHICTMFTIELTVGKQLK